MRTSHKEMRRKINTEVSKITDEELFSSAAFAAYLTDIAEAVTKRYKRRLRVETIYDTSENAMIACTNNRNILINTGNYISQSMPYRKLKAESILGLVGHEVGHMLFTNFRISETYFSELSYGRLYPQMELSEEEQESFTEVTDYFKTGTEAQKQAIRKAAKLLLNILEDAYIEARICDRYTGRFATGIHLNNIRFTEMMPSVTEQLTNGCYRFSVFCNLLNQYCRSGDINNRDGYAGELLDLFYDVLPLVDDVIYDEDMKRRCYAVNRILLMVWAYIKEVIEKAEEEENTSETLQKLNKEIPQMAEVPSLNGTPIAAGGSVDTQKYISGRTEIEGKLRKATEQESGRIPWMKTDDFDEGEEGGVEQNLSYHGAGYSTAGDDISRILTAVAKEKVQEELSLALTEEMQQEAEHIRLGNAHSGIKIIINRMQEIEESYIQQYQSVAPPLLAISKQIQKRLQRVFKDMSFTGKESALLMGRRIEPRLLMDRKGRFFSRNRLPSEKKSLAVAVLMDESGSMADQDRVTYARAAGIIIYDFCKAMDVPILIMGHTDDNNVQLYAYTDFDSMDKMDRYRLMDLSARYGNRDGAALRYVAERLLKQPEEKKLLLLVSDGQPAGTGGYLGSAAEADLRGIKKEYANKGILFVAAAIGDDKENIERIYGDAFLDISDLTKLPFLLVKKIEKELKG